MNTQTKKKRYAMPKLVRIEVRGGVAEVVSKPEGISVLIVDWDAQQNPADELYYDNLAVIRNGVVVK